MAKDLADMEKAVDATILEKEMEFNEKLANISKEMGDEPWPVLFDVIQNTTDMINDVKLDIDADFEQIVESGVLKIDLEKANGELDNLASKIGNGYNNHKTQKNLTTNIRTSMEGLWPF
jgi:hypothetical protein